MAAAAALSLLGATGHADEPPHDFVAAADTLSAPVHPEVVTESFDVDMADAATPVTGASLYVEVTRPDPAVHGDGPWPVILEVSPYHGTLHTRTGHRIFPDPLDADGQPIGLTGYFAPRGYAVVMVDLRGTGRSSGCLDHLGANDQQDLHRIVEWAADQPWSTGEVAMTGHSYVGSTPSIAAAQRPRGLVTIVPSAGLASMYDHQFQSGVPYNLQWVGPMASYEQLAIERQLPGGDNAGDDLETTGCGLPQSAALAGPGQVTGQYEGWHAERDSREGAAAADIPIFIVHGVNDNAARIPAAEWFFGDREPHPGDKVWIGQWDHGSGVHPNRRFDQWQYALHAWFDAHLQHRDVETGPPVEAFLNAPPSAEDRLKIGGQVHTADRWDPSADRPLTVALDASRSGGDADGALVLDRQPDEDGQVSYAAVAEQGLTFVSDPVPGDLVLVGLPDLRLDVSFTGTSQVHHLVAEVSHVDHEGNAGPLTTCALQVGLREGIDTVTPIAPRTTYELDPQCFTVASHVRAGDRIQLELDSESPHHVGFPSLDPQVTVATGPGRSQLTLPLVGTPTLHDDVPITVPGDDPPGSPPAPPEPEQEPAPTPVDRPRALPTTGGGLGIAAALALGALLVRPGGGRRSVRRGR